MTQFQVTFKTGYLNSLGSNTTDFEQILSLPF